MKTKLFALLICTFASLQASAQLPRLAPNMLRHCETFDDRFTPELTKFIEKYDRIIKSGELTAQDREFLAEYNVDVDMETYQNWHNVETIGCSL